MSGVSLGQLGNTYHKSVEQFSEMQREYNPMRYSGSSDGGGRGNEMFLDESFSSLRVGKSIHASVTLDSNAY